MSSPFRIPTQLCSSPPVYQEGVGRLVRLICENVVPHARAHNALALVLTGSLARGEGTVILRPGVGCEILSDFDLVVVLDAQRTVRQQTPFYAELSRGLSRDLGLGPCSHVDIGCLSMSGLRTPTPSIFFSELRRHGKVLWGRSDVLNAIPVFPSLAIPPWDTLTLVHNRLLEFLCSVPEVAREQAQTPRLYAQCKAYSDAITAILAISGNYLPSYADRFEQFEEFAPHTFRDAGFMRELSPWIELKLRGDVQPLEQRWGGSLGSKEFAEGLCREEVRLANYLGEVWSYVARAVLAERASDLTPVEEQLLRQDRRSLLGLLRGWYRFSRSGFRLPRPGQIRHGRPELLTYLAAVAVLRALPAYRENHLEELSSHLASAARYHPLSVEFTRDIRHLWRVLCDDLAQLRGKFLLGGKWESETASRPPSA